MYATGQWEHSKYSMNAKISIRCAEWKWLIYSSMCWHYIHWSWCVEMNASCTHVPTSAPQSGPITSATTMWVGRVWSGRPSFSETREQTSLLCWKVMLRSRFLVTTTWQCGLVNDCRCMLTTGRPLVTTLGGNCFIFVCFCAGSVNAFSLFYCNASCISTHLGVTIYPLKCAGDIPVGRKGIRSTSGVTLSLYVRRMFRFISLGPKDLLQLA